MTRERLLSKLQDSHIKDDKAINQVSVEALKLAVVTLVNHFLNQNLDVYSFAKKHPQDTEEVKLSFSYSNDQDGLINDVEIDVNELSWIESTRSPNQVEPTIKETTIDPLTFMFVSTMIQEKNKLQQEINQQHESHQEVYDPLSKDMDNDGIIDRYDADFRDSTKQEIGQKSQSERSAKEYESIQKESKKEREYEPMSLER